MRSSRSPRSAIASGRPPAPSMPRAVWSAAITMTRARGRRRARGPRRRGRRLGDRLGPARPRLARARAAAPHALTASSIRATHLGLVGHRVRARQPRGDERPRGVAEAHHALELPAGQQAVAERAAEGVAGAEAVDDLDRHGRDLDRPRRRARPSTPRGPCLTTASSSRARARPRRRRAGRACRPRSPTRRGCRRRRWRAAARARTCSRASSREPQNIGR